MKQSNKYIVQVYKNGQWLTTGTRATWEAAVMEAQRACKAVNGEDFRVKIKDAI